MALLHQQHARSRGREPAEGTRPLECLLCREGLPASRTGSHERLEAFNIDQATPPLVVRVGLDNDRMHKRLVAVRCMSGDQLVDRAAREAQKALPRFGQAHITWVFHGLRRLGIINVATLLNPKEKPNTPDQVAVVPSFLENINTSATLFRLEAICMHSIRAVEARSARTGFGELVNMIFNNPSLKGIAVTRRHQDRLQDF